jgi:hypothetical protein
MGAEIEKGECHRLGYWVIDSNETLIWALLMFLVFFFKNSKGV